MKNKTILIVFFVSLIANQLWAEGEMEGLNRIHPGAKMMLERNGYRFNSNDMPISLNNRAIIDFPNENGTNNNPYDFDKNVIYITHFDVNQWLEKSALATTGNQRARQALRIDPDINTLMNISGMGNGVRIFIRNIPDRFLKQMSGNVKNALLEYVGVQTFQMADGSSQVFPVFQLTNLFGDIVTQAMRDFYNAFEAGIYKTEDGYQYSKVYGRTFARDIATNRELLEWNGNQWIVLIGE